MVRPWPVWWELASCGGGGMGSVQERQDVMMEAFLGHVSCQAAHVVWNVLPGAMLEEEASHFAAPLLGGEEEGRLCLRGERNGKNLSFKIQAQQYLKRPTQFPGLGE